MKSTQTVIETLPILLKSLRLPNIKKQWSSFEKKAIEEGWSYGEFLKALCDYEVSQRDTARIERYLKEYILPKGKSLSNFDFAACKPINQGLVMNLANDSAWLERGENLLLFGPSGVGKTHLSAAIGRSLIELGIRVKFITGCVLLQQLLAAKADLQLPNFLAKLDKYELLIIDDIGYVKKSEAETGVLFELISYRYEFKSLLITANQTFSEWDSIFADSTMTVAAIDRLVHHATIIEIQTQSFRQKAAFARSKKGSQNKTDVSPSEELK